MPRVTPATIDPARYFRIDARLAELGHDDWRVCNRGTASREFSVLYFDVNHWAWKRPDGSSYSCTCELEHMPAIIHFAYSRWLIEERGWSEQFYSKQWHWTKFRYGGMDNHEADPDRLSALFAAMEVELGITT